MNLTRLAAVVSETVTVELATFRVDAVKAALTMNTVAPSKVMVEVYI